MPQRLDGVAGAHKGFEESDFKRLANRQGTEPGQQFLHFGTAGKIAAGNAMAQDVLAKFCETLFVRRLVNPINGGPVQAH